MIIQLKKKGEKEKHQNDYWTPEDFCRHIHSQTHTHTQCIDSINLSIFNRQKKTDDDGVDKNNVWQKRGMSRKKGGVRFVVIDFFIDWWIVIIEEEENRRN